MKLSIKNYQSKIFSLMIILGFLINSSLFLIGQNIGDELPSKGLNIKLENGVSMNLRIEEKKFRIYFIDAENLIIKPPFDYARLRYENFRGVKNKKTISLKKSSSDSYLSSPRRINPPYYFWIRVTMVDKKDEKKNKSFSRMKFRQ